MVTKTRAHYPNLAIEFYRNINIESDPYRTDITTTSKGVIVHLHRAILTDILGIKKKGHSIFFERACTSIAKDPTSVYSEALSMFSFNAQAIGKRYVKSNSLEGTWKVASLLIGTNLSLRSQKTKQTICR